MKLPAKEDGIYIVASVETRREKKEEEKKNLFPKFRIPICFQDLEYMFYICLMCK